MRLTIKLVAWFFACAVVAVGLNAFYGARGEVARYEADLGERHVVMGRVLRAAFAAVMEKEGEARAVSVLAYTDKRVVVDVRWVYLRQDAPPERRPRVSLDRLGALREEHEVHEIDRNYLVSYVPVRLEGRELTALEFAESLGGEKDVVRHAVLRELRSVGVMSLAIGVVAAIGGVILVARPIRRLVEHARRVGIGDLSPAATPEGRDELAELGREMNAMCVQLEEAHHAKLRALEQLRHAERLSTVGVLASGLAHELGTPLNVITLRAKAIAQGRSAGEQARDAATSIEQQATRMTRLVRQLLDFARRRTPPPAPVTVADVVRRASDLIETMATRAEVEIETSADAELSVLGDAVQLEQVLTNILLNAVQVSPPGEQVTVKAAIAKEPKPPAYVTEADSSFVAIEIRDHGPGIAPEVLPHVFEPFFTTKEVGEGTGLGLAVCYGIIRDHGGWIDVVSQPGEGAAFVVYLPRERESS